MRRVIAITFLNHFVSGALTLLIPLLLLSKNVNLADIGIVLSALPIVFLVARLLLAALGDTIGWSHIFLLANWPATLVSTLIYYAANSVPAFFAGKVVEGLKESSYWAVNRTAVFHLSPKKEGRAATLINAVIWLSTAVGSAAAGVGIAYLGFSSTLAVLAAVAACLGIPAAMLWKTGKVLKKQKTNILAMLTPRGKSSTFWIVSIGLMFNSFAVYPLTTLLLPVFMSGQLGYDYITIGLYFMVYNLIASAVTMLSLKSPLNIVRVVILSGVGLFSTVFLAGSGLLFPGFLCALAFVRGYSIAYFEHSVAEVSKNSKNISVDIGWLHVPMRFAEFGSVLASGFLVTAVGFAPVFAATGIAFVLFVSLCHKALQTLGADKSGSTVGLAPESP
jgi:MFS family permease